jgi:hypothetical protein
MPWSRRAATAAFACTMVLVAIVLALPGQAAAAQKAKPPCSSYPVPGSLAPSGARVPAALTARYSILSEPQRAADRLKPDQISSSVSAAGLILSGTRFLGKAAFGGRIYVIPAQHVLGEPLLPPRCVPADRRALQRALLPELEKDYRHAALCVEVLYATSSVASCPAAGGDPDALLYVKGTPGFGLVADGTSSVTVTYAAAPPRTVAVHHNSFVIVSSSDTGAPCGVQWLQPTGNVVKVVTGCSYLGAETQALVTYRAYVATKLATLQSQLAGLGAAIAAGDLAQAESAWLTAHLTWLEIGQDDGAYGCFGDLGGEIDGLAAGHPLGTADPGFTGFHKVEFDLWTEHDLAAAAADTATLQSLLATLMQTPLAAYLPATAAGIGNWVLRPHEVLEDALRDTLTGDDDYGSDTSLAALSADVAAVQELLGVLSPVLSPVAPQLVPIADRQLGALLAAIGTTTGADGSIALADLPARQREQIDADAGAALETLAPVPDLITSTGSNAPD